MARSWLASSPLPSEYWWYGKLTTPHELMYKQKPDLRNLIPLFCVAYPKYKTKTNMDPQSCKAILVGKSDKTHALTFYHPATKQEITTSSYLLDETIPAGPTFNLPYEGGLFFNKFCENADDHRPPLYPPSSTVNIK